jgi:hypothetical protein
MTSVPRAASPCCWWSDALPCVRAPHVFRACANGRRRVVSASRNGAPREGPRLRTTARAGPGPAVLLIARLASVSQGNPRGAPSVRGLRRPGDGPRSPRASPLGAGTSARSDERRATMSSPSLSAHGAAAFMESGEVTPWGAEVRGTRCDHSGACQALATLGHSPGHSCAPRALDATIAKRGVWCPPESASALDAPGKMTLGGSLHSV